MMPAPDKLAALHSHLLRFARLQLRDDALAEDVVQDTLLAAMNGLNAFSGEAALKTWVFSILKNKLVDVLRTRDRSVNVSALAGEEESFDAVFDTLFKANGHWAEGKQPAKWGDPEEAIEQQQFWLVFEACLNCLPANTGRVFMMREFLDLDIDAICRELCISASNCYVILHRARHQLRGCLEKNWFGPGDLPC
ncbi:MAG: hypothetical protein RIR70_1437 [Pseudomonadota bacterium]|jgi:RNA polymerase sigma-70 factor (ECF subfamily)